MADKTVTVRPSGGTYTTLQAAITGEVAANANLVTMDGILTISIEGTWSSVDTAAVNVTGFTTDATHYVNITTDSANKASIAWSSSKYILQRGNASYSIILTSPYTRLKGVQIKNAVSNGSGIQVIGNGCIVDGCHAVLTYGVALDCINGVSTTITIANSIFVGGSYRCADTSNSAGNVNLYNCIFAKSTAAGVRIANASRIKLVNCYSGGHSSTAYTTAASAIMTTCYSDDGTNSTPTAAYSTSTFTNVTAGSEDFSLVTGSDLIGAGTDLSADATYPFDWDITGATRSTWDVGAAWFDAGGGGVTGTSTSTQVKQTGTASGSVTPLAITGTSASTQIKQTSTGMGSQSYSATSTGTQAKQTSIGNGTQSFSGTSTGTQARQTGTGSGVQSYSATSTGTQAKQTSTGTGDQSFSGTSVGTQAKQTSTGSGTQAYSGTSTGTQAKQTSTGEGFAATGIAGVSNSTQVKQTGTASGTVVQVAITGTSTTLQTRQTSTGSGEQAFSGTSVGTQAKQTTLGNGTVVAAGIAGDASTTQAKQTGSGSGIVEVIPITGTSTGTQAVQTSAGTGTLEYSATVTGTQAKQTGTGTGTSIVSFVGTSTGLQARQLSDAFGSVGPSPIPRIIEYFVFEGERTVLYSSDIQATADFIFAGEHNIVKIMG